MKIHTEKTVYQPVSITFETKVEFDTFKSFLKEAKESDESGDGISLNLLESETLNELLLGLEDI